MKVGVVADVHVGNHKRFGGESVGSINTRCRLVLDVFKRAIDRAEELGCTHFVVVGDLVDYARPEPAILAALQGILREVQEVMEVFLMMGNHDRSSSISGDNALAPLAPFATIVDKPLRICGEGTDAMQGTQLAEVLLVPFQPGEVHAWLDPAVRALVSERADAEDSRERLGGGKQILYVPHQLLLMHMGIRDDKTPPWLKDSPSAVHHEALHRMCEEFRIGHVMAGDWHEHRVWKGTGMPGHRPYIMQLGALAPTGFDNPGLKGYGTLATWEPRGELNGGPRVQRIEIPGPRFVKVRTSDERDAALAAAKEHKVFISQVVEPDGLVDATALLTSAQHAYDLGGVEVLPDAAIAQADARMAASVASSAETFDEALDAFVSAMPLPDHVNRKSVHARAKEYVK